jgi:hypothetical protein
MAVGSVTPHGRCLSAQAGTDLAVAARRISVSVQSMMSIFEVHLRDSRMWVRRTPVEVIRDRKSVWPPLSTLMLIAFLGFMFGVAASGEGGGRHGPHRPITSMSIGFGVAGALAAVAAYMLRRRFGKPLFSPKCGQRSGGETNPLVDEG